MIEIADGLFQRETKMILDDPGFQKLIDHVFFSAGDSMGAESGVRLLRQSGFTPKAVTGLVSRSLLSRMEAELATGLPCLSLEDILSGRVLDTLGCGEGVATSALGS